MSEEPAGIEPRSAAGRRMLWRSFRTRSDFRMLCAASFFIDFGLCLYFLLFSLLLVAHGFTDASIGIASASLTAGSIAGSISSALLVRKAGLRSAVITFAIGAPLILGVRLFYLTLPAQVVLGFLSGVAMSLWVVCFSPTLSRLTTQESRTLGFSFFSAMGIGSGAVAGVIGGALPAMLRRHAPWAGHGDSLRAVLVLSCAVTAMAVVPMVRLRFEPVATAPASHRPASTLLVRMLIVVGLWSFSLNFFTPFANVYLTRALHLSVARIGAVYAVSQLCQVVAVLLAPFLYRRLGLVSGIALMQGATGCVLFLFSRVHEVNVALVVYLALCSLQWMSGPGLMALVMNHVPEENRSYAAAAQGFVSMSSQVAASLAAGRLFSRAGYRMPLALNALLACVAGGCTFWLLAVPVRSRSALGGPCEGFGESTAP